MNQKNEVIDLRSYRSSEADDTWSDDTGPQYLPAGTTLLLGQYIITGYLNCGGFGITYFASDSLGRTVVIKECFPSELCFRSGNRMVARSRKFRKELDSIVTHFVKEAHRLSTVRHDNIVHVHQIFEENDTAYMAMDFIDGQDLLAIVEDGKKKFSAKEIESLVRKMLGAIKYVHDRGMLHRDISPDNILMDGNGEPILIDFGAARDRGKKKAQQDYSKLKFVKDGYSPQEFYIAGGEQGTWSDLYSFAASMYHVICGELPIDGQRRLAALAAKKPDPYEPLAGRITGYSMRF
ncbi:MAG: serine/threonine protein kinase, partial [Boseongicola sp.]